MGLMLTDSAHSGPRPGPRYEAVSAVGLATVVAALHLALLAGRVPARGLRGRQTAFLVWQQPESVPAEVQHDCNRVPSNPTRSYSAGRLALTAGMVIVVLAFQMQVMRVGAALAR